MNKAAILFGVLVVGSTVLTGCATVSGEGAVAASSAAPTGESGVPAHVDLSRWDGVVGAPVIEANVTGPLTLEDVVATSELVVVVRVVDQGPFPDHDWIATESNLEVIETLKGDAEEKSPRLYSVGKPVYLEGYDNVEGVADPPLFDETYVMFLSRYPEVPDAEGKLVPVDDVWTAAWHAAYVEGADGVFRWNGERDEDGEFRPMTLDQLRELAAAKQ